jgi:imidazoleglycerol phosphate synthase cyclase subunit
MTRPRLIPCLLLKHGLLVRSQGFHTHQAIGNPISTIERFSHWNVDELLLLDISPEDRHDLRRDDLHIRYQGTTVVELLEQIAEVSFMPLGVGGRIRTLEDISMRLAVGADKCIVNTKAVEDPGFISEAAQRFGDQCIVVSIDAKKTSGDDYEVVTERGTRFTGMSPANWAKQAQELGAGEIFLNSIDRDGSGQGVDLTLVSQVTAAVSIPVIACGGVGRYEDLPPAITEGGAAAVAAANIFHFFELSYPLAKASCLDAGLDMRPNRLDSPWFPREPVYDHDAEVMKVEERLARVGSFPSEGAEPRSQIRWCTRCVYPSISAAPMEFDDSGVCTGCQMADMKSEISADEWDRRRDLLVGILEQNRSRDGSRHDCVIPVSGGKDSWFQTHVIKNELGFNPLLVTYNGNNWTDVGWKNVHLMKEVFGVDHLFYSPSVDLLKRLNRQAFWIMGDMNWHAHVGITTLPVATAARFDIPLVIWGEHGYLDLSGQFSLDDFPEMSYRDRLEHFARGFEWNYFVGREGISAQDMGAWKYPSDSRIFELGLRGIYLGNYVYWEANEHTQMVIDKYGFQVNDEPFDRTYRLMSNLDDMHENGVHDYLKYIKFGYGRCTDHACKDIRAGRMTRDEAIELVKRYDHVKPRDLQRWLDYVGMSEDDFDAFADTFRDPRVWRVEDGSWVKDNLWDA